LSLGDKLDLTSQLNARLARAQTFLSVLRCPSSVRRAVTGGVTPPSKD